MLRVAREIFALLPADTLLITATVEAVDTRTGQNVEQPVLSAVVAREALAPLEFDRLDPSDAIGGFMHRGDFKATRRSGAFLPITPFNANDLKGNRSIGNSGLDELRVRAEALRGDIRSLLADLNPPQDEATEETT
jgi:hypothetical protein